MADSYTGTGREKSDRAKAKKAGDAADVAGGSKINQGLGDLIKSTESGAESTPAPVGATPTPTPMPVVAKPIGEPKRTDFPPGLGGQGEYNRALSAWRASQSKPVSGGKSLGGGR